MTKSRSKRKRNTGASPGHGPTQHPSTTIPVLQRTVGALALLVAAGTALVLALKNLDAVSLPGCGPGSACDQVAASAWSKIPVINWPVSFVGVAYFLALLTVWGGTRASTPPLLRLVVRCGVVASLGFTIIMLVEGHICQYCVAAHAGNLVFWLTLESVRSRMAAPASRTLGTVGLVFVLASFALGVAHWRQNQALAERGERELSKSIGEIIAATSQKTAAMVDPASVTTTHPATTATNEASPDAVETTPQGFTGRYRWGPEQAPLRLVLFTDYQCVDCNRIEREIRLLLEERDDISVSLKHFPMCNDCNPRFAERNPHANACWAARAAEAAGILRGNDAFWEMHHWLFDRHGSFTRAQLLEGLRELGYDATEFTRVMTGPETLARVEADIQEALTLGLHFTPMIFINGVEFKGWYAKDAVVRAVQSVAATNPPPMTAAHDQPPTASEKYVADWREQRVRRLPADNRTWTRGATDAAVRIVVWGDYQEPFTAQADGIIRAFLEQRADASYAFRHYPVDQGCNPEVKSTMHPQACLAARAAEAAGALGGAEGYWRMHDWLMDHQDGLNAKTLREAVPQLGLEADVFFATLDDAAVATAIVEDVHAAKQLGLRSIPMVFVNEKWVPRWLREGDRVLERILEEAGREQGHGTRTYPKTLSEPRP
ncbi:MAG: thioredoxin domain-containing protein [Planctomycetes bacterium]|nr:thioredoxin domain-containing protein [Planctomycetota bacterium]